ncbi:hypothetical protein Bca52824_050301 [Brassica carinata]|uniref:Sieve element occlusion C-terminal domain-containing protein n=1 Tax=Brassica carinata TaxID=52824 RepID=A0A8X7RMK0_BRACI|nr:hypothetical protein Bca52824_050301 [Brassica carinata]
MPYEVVWVPIVDPIEDFERSPSLQNKFEALREPMPWYTVDSPKLIERHVVEFMRERWHFMNKPILVVLDPQGNEASLNALHMIWIWGTEAFPFTRAPTAKDSNVKLQMAYVGKRNHSHREQIRRISEAVRAENLSHSWAEPALMWFFWARLESMLYSKIQLGKADDHDEVRTSILLT